MTYSYTPPDNEFAVSTGSNVNSGPGTSTFDNPPNASKELVVTSNPGDPTPTIFSLGDTYDVSWGGFGGGGFIEDAVVVRSDMAPGGGGAIVFEGLNEDGELTQVVWTPEFDLEGWYSANYNPSMEPGFYTTDQDPNYTHQYVCFASETRVLTPGGAQVVAALAVGDRVHTVDHGVEPVRWIGRQDMLGHGSNAPILFEAGSIGNARPLRLSQQHRILIRSPAAEIYFGATEVLVPAIAMVNGTTIRFAPCTCVTYVHLLMRRHEVIFAEGAQCESLFLGAQARQWLGQEDALMRAMAEARSPIRHDQTARPVLTAKEARLVLGAHSYAPSPPPAYAMV